MELETLAKAWFLFFLATPLLWFLATKLSPTRKPSSSSSSTTIIPKAYPIIGSIFSISANKHRRIQWISDILQSSPTATFTLHRAFGSRQIFTANPANVQHILKTHFPIYPKGSTVHNAVLDFLGNGIFSSDGDTWKFQRQIASHEFNTRSLRKFVETVVDAELSQRLIPILSHASQTKIILPDFQDILQRFTFDNICRISFGYDPEYLLPSLPGTAFARAFDEGIQISSRRINAAVPLFWKIKKLLNIESEKRLSVATSKVRDLARKIIKDKKQELKEKPTLESANLLSKLLSSGHSDEVFVMEMVLSFILGGRDTTSAGMTWFFYILSKHPHVEKEILKEINEKYEASASAYDEVKEMVYTHAALCESMRLYPPVAANSKEAAKDDILPDGTFVKKGTMMTFHIYAMGRSEKIWGTDWAEFRPERWLNRVQEGEKWKFVAVDPFIYPIFQPGPRVCLGKEMAFLQMKRVITGVLKRFRVVPMMVDGMEPEYTAYLTSLVKGGLPVMIENRNSSHVDT